MRKTSRIHYGYHELDEPCPVCAEHAAAEGEERAIAAAEAADDREGDARED